MGQKKLVGMVTVLIALFMLTVNTYAFEPDPSTLDVADSCVTNGYGNWTVFAYGPYYGAGDECFGAGDECSLVTYEVRSNYGLNADHAFTLVKGGNTVLESMTSMDIYDECEGARALPMGYGDCTSTAVRVNPEGDVATFTIAVSGIQIGTETSVLVKSGKTAEACALMGLGEDSPVHPLVGFTTEQNINFKDCNFVAKVSRMTGKALGLPQIAEGSGDGCTIEEVHPSEMQITLPNGKTQNLNHLQGGLSSGDNTCWYQYYWGSWYLMCDSNDNTY